MAMQDCYLAFNMTERAGDKFMTLARICNNTCNMVLLLRHVDIDLFPNISGNAGLLPGFLLDRASWCHFHDFHTHLRQHSQDGSHAA